MMKFAACLLVRKGNELGALCPAFSSQSGLTFQEHNSPLKNKTIQRLNFSRAEIFPFYSTVQYSMVEIEVSHPLSSDLGQEDRRTAVFKGRV